MSKDQKADAVVSGVDAGKREFVARLIGTTALAAPVVAAFAMTGLTVNEAHAASNLRQG